MKAEGSEKRGPADVLPLVSELAASLQGGAGSIYWSVEKKTALILRYYDFKPSAQRFDICVIIVI